MIDLSWAALKNLPTATLFHLSGNPVSLLSLFFAALIFAAGFGLSWTLRRFARPHLEARLSIDRGVGYALMRIVHYVIIALAMVISLQSIGFQLTSLTVLGGFLGVGLGFGLKNVMENFVSGLILLFEQPIRVGDKVTVQEHIGTVQRIGIRSTVIDTFDNVTLILPNAMFVQERVINWSHNDPRIRLHLEFGVAYGSDIDLVKSTALGCLKDLDGVLAKPAAELRFLGFGDSSLDFDLLFWTVDARQQFRIKSDATYALEAALRRAGVEIPFPQRDIHVRSGLDKMLK